MTSFFNSQPIQDLGEVLVAAAAESDEDELGVEVASTGERMSRLERGEDALGSREILERGERLVVGGHAVLRPAGVAEDGVFGPDTGIVEPGGDRVRVFDLAVLVGEYGGARAVKNRGAAAAERRRSSGLDS